MFGITCENEKPYTLYMNQGLRDKLEQAAIDNSWNFLEVKDSGLEQFPQTLPCKVELDEEGRLAIMKWAGSRDKFHEACQIMAHSNFGINTPFPSPTCSNQNGTESLIVRAWFLKDLKVLWDLIANPEYNVDGPSGSGFSVLWNICHLCKSSYQQKELAEKLLARGADPDAATSCSSPLYEAVRNGNAELATMLLKAGNGTHPWVPSLVPIYWISNAWYEGKGNSLFSESPELWKLAFQKSEPFIAQKQDMEVCPTKQDLLSESEFIEKLISELLAEGVKPDSLLSQTSYFYESVKHRRGDIAISLLKAGEGIHPTDPSVPPLAWISDLWNQGSEKNLYWANRELWNLAYEKSKPFVCQDEEMDLAPDQNEPMLD